MSASFVRFCGAALLVALMLRDIASAQPARRNVQPRPPLRNYIALLPPELADFASPDWRVKAATLERMVANGDRSVPILIAGIRTASEKTQDFPLNVSEREVGRHCAIALTRIGDASACKPLVQYLEFPEREARREIVRAIAALHCDEAIAALLQLWADAQEDRTNKREAAFALASYGRQAAGPIASADIAREQERLAIEPLLEIALTDEKAVRDLVSSGEPKARKRAAAAMEELRQRREQWGTLPTVKEIEPQARALLKARKPAEALALWERVLDSGLYNYADAETAHENMLTIKNQAGLSLYKQPVSVWKNKVFILTGYDADLPGPNGQVVKHVRYALSSQELKNIQKRLRDTEECVRLGSCGAIRMVNEVEVVRKPWTIFRPTIRTHAAGVTAPRWQIPRPDLDRVFDFKQKYLDKGYHCVVFQLRSEPGVFEMDGGAAGGRSVVNAQRGRFEDADITAPCHEWLHILHSAIWEQGGFSWTQCLPLHDQIRDMQLRTAWKTGRFPLQEEIFVDCMRRYTTQKMWASAGNLKLDELPDAEEN